MIDVINGEQVVFSRSNPSLVIYIPRANCQLTLGLVDREELVVLHKAERFLLSMRWKAELLGTGKGVV